MTSRTIYLVMADTDYEGSLPVRSFETKPDAESFAQRCRDYTAKKPRVPDVDAPDADWDQYTKREKAWEARHPAKPFTYRDAFSVMPLKLFKATL